MTDATAEDRAMARAKAALDLPEASEDVVRTSLAYQSALLDETLRDLGRAVAASPPGRLVFWLASKIPGGRET